MADDAIGAHELYGADRILRRLVQIGLRRDALAGRPLAGQRADEIAILQAGFLVAPPLRAAAELGRVERGLAEARKISPPAFVHRIGVLEILGIERFHEGRVGAGQEGGRLQQFVGTAGQAGRRGLVCHFRMLGQDFLGPADSVWATEPWGGVVAPLGRQFNASQG
ncbi:MAG: hypothetical protein WDM81_12040 [Rhizomicrobium sp.]